ncbi:hypothetical protein FHETE_3951 [Fusarium heterosporum]|uniref:Uncharacterized protein n=1 Tax=Fusarium heterosporum TaxID=42747 RepID=A0A8H5TKE1_FUSHE|nr:hypothetical protein FHETE_3951 [Fusarium heterosporum]
MDTTIKSFAGPNEPETSDRFLSNSTSNRNEAVIVGGVVIGSVLLIALLGVAYMFYKKRVSKMKALEAKTGNGDDYPERMQTHSEQSTDPYRTRPTLGSNSFLKPRQYDVRRSVVSALHEVLKRTNISNQKLRNGSRRPGPLLHTGSAPEVADPNRKTNSEPIKMHLTSILQLRATIALVLVLFSCLALASSNSDNTHVTLLQRDEDVGSGCSTEGQWHCMTNSFQRCAGGQWSIKMAMAEGTKCVPGGYTDDYNFRIERDGERQDENRDGSNENQSNGASVGPRSSVGGTISVVVLLCVILLIA